MTAVRPKALPALTGARGIAAWFVVLYHVRPGMAAYTPDAQMAVFAKGYLAVDLFFMLSGFVLWLNYAERLRSGGIAAVAEFYWRRIARIWPLHVFILGYLLLLVLMLAATGRSDPGNYPLGELPLHILMIQNWGFTAVLTWNHPAWSISCEFAAYLLFPMLAIFADWRRIPTIPLIGGLIALAFSLWFATDMPRLGIDIPQYGLRRCLIEFTMGTIICALWQRWHGGSGAAWISGIATAVAALAWISGLDETFAAPLIFASLLAWLAFTDSVRSNPLKSRFTLWLGDISYATYLTHFPLFIAFKLAFVNNAAHVAPYKIATFLMLLLAASALLHRTIEKPAQRVLNRLFARRKMTATA